MQLEKDVIYEPVMHLTSRGISLVLKDTTGRVYADVTEQVIKSSAVRDAVIQECADAITATGAELSISINDSALSGYYSSAEICRQLKSKE